MRRGSRWRARRARFSSRCGTQWIQSVSSPLRCWRPTCSRAARRRRLPREPRSKLRRHRRLRRTPSKSLPATNARTRAFRTNERAPRTTNDLPPARTQFVEPPESEIRSVRDDRGVRCCGRTLVASSTGPRATASRHTGSRAERDAADAAGSDAGSGECADGSRRATDLTPARGPLDRHHFAGAHQTRVDRRSNHRRSDRGQPESGFGKRQDSGWRFFDRLGRKRPEPVVRSFDRHRCTWVEPEDSRSLPERRRASRYVARRRDAVGENFVEGSRRQDSGNREGRYAEGHQPDAGAYDAEWRDSAAGTFRRSEPLADQPVWSEYSGLAWREERGNNFHPAVFATAAHHTEWCQLDTVDRQCHRPERPA